MSGRRAAQRARTIGDGTAPAAAPSFWGMRATSTAIVLVEDGRVLAANRRFSDLDRALAGQRPWRALPDGRTQTHGRHPSLRAAVLREAGALGSQAAASPRTVRLERVGAEQVVELHVERMGGPGGSGVLALVNEVTDRARAESQIERDRQVRLHEERMRAVGDLAAGMASGLGDALGQIALRVSALRRDGAVAAARRDDVESIGRLVGEATRLVSRLGDFGRLRRDRPLGAVDLRSVIDAAVATFEAEASAPAHSASPRCDVVREVPRLPAVRGATADLRRVFVGLLDNARDAMPRGGRVRITAHQRELGIVVTVEDDGPGIPAPHIERIFDPFFTTKERRGTGLGLSIAYGVMSRLGGHISAANRKQGGALFTLTFPTARERDGASARQQRLELGS